MLLVDDHHHAERRAVDAGRDAGVCGGQLGSKLCCPGQKAVYELTQRVLVAQQYRRLSKGQKGLVRRFLTRMTGLSRAQ